MKCDSWLHFYPAAYFGCIYMPNYTIRPRNYSIRYGFRNELVWRKQKQSRMKKRLEWRDKWEREVESKVWSVKEGMRWEGMKINYISAYDDIYWKYFSFFHFWTGKVDVSFTQALNVITFVVVLHAWYEFTWCVVSMKTTLLWCSRIEWNKWNSVQTVHKIIK